MNDKKSKKNNGILSKKSRIQEKTAIQKIDNQLASQSGTVKLSQLKTLQYLTIYKLKNQFFTPLNFFKKENDFIINNNPQLSNRSAISETLSGYLIVLSRDRNLLYVSENVSSYLKLKSIEVLLSCEHFEDILHPNDAKNLINVFQAADSQQQHVFYCLWNDSKIKRRVHTKDNSKKKIKINGRFIANGNLFVATCTPFLCLENREYLVAASPTCFTSVHSVDLTFLELCEKGQNILDYSNNQIDKYSLYDVLHAEDLDLVRKRHKNLLNTKSQKGQFDSVKILKRDGTYVNCLVNIYYCGNTIICKYQLLSQNDRNYYENNQNSQNDLSEADCGEDSRHGLSSIDSLHNKETECDQQYSLIECNTNFQKVNKRKYNEDIDSNDSNSFNNQDQKFSFSTNSCIDKEPRSLYNDEQYPLPHQSYGTNNSYIISLQTQYPPRAPTLTDSQLLPTNIVVQNPILSNSYDYDYMNLSNKSSVELRTTTTPIQNYENKIYPPVQNYLTEQQNYRNKNSPSSSLCSETENSSILNTFYEESAKFFHDYLNEDYI